MTQTLDFTGDTTTLIGFIGIVATFAIMISVYRSYWNSPFRK
jgi:hypothetical protein